MLFQFTSGWKVSLLYSSRNFSLNRKLFHSQQTVLPEVCLSPLGERDPREECTLSVTSRSKPYPEFHHLSFPQECGDSVQKAKTASVAGSHY